MSPAKLLTALIILTLVSVDAWAKPESAAPLDPRMERLWQQHWREFAAFYIEHEGQYVCFSAYDRNLANSRGLTARDYLKQSARTFTVQDDKGRDVEKLHTKPQAEVDVMVKMLPEVSPGHYGFIHSGLITQIQGPDAVVLREVWLVDARQVASDKDQATEELRRQTWRNVEDAFRDRDRRGPSVMDRHFQGRDLVDWQFEAREAAARRQFRWAERSWRIIGFDTRNLVEGKRWPVGGKEGLHIAIVKVEDGLVTAVPATRLGKGLTEQQFEQVLQQRGMTPQRFCEVLTELKRQNPLRYRHAMLAAIEGRSPNEPASQPNTEVREAS